MSPSCKYFLSYIYQSWLNFIHCLHTSHFHPIGPRSTKQSGGQCGTATPEKQGLRRCNAKSALPPEVVDGDAKRKEQLTAVLGAIKGKMKGKGKGKGQAEPAENSGWLDPKFLKAGQSNDNEMTKPRNSGDKKEKKEKKGRGKDEEKSTERTKKKKDDGDEEAAKDPKRKRKKIQPEEQDKAEVECQKDEVQKAEEEDAKAANTPNEEEEEEDTKNRSKKATPEDVEEIADTAVEDLETQQQLLEELKRVKIKELDARVAVRNKMQEAGKYVAWAGTLPASHPDADIIETMNRNGAEVERLIKEGGEVKMERKKAWAKAIAAGLAAKDLEKAMAEVSSTSWTLAQQALKGPEATPVTPGEEKDKPETPAAVAFADPTKASGELNGQLTLNQLKTVRFYAPFGEGPKKLHSSLPTPELKQMKLHDLKAVRISRPPHTKKTIGQDEGSGETAEATPVEEAEPEVEAKGGKGKGQPPGGI